MSEVIVRTIPACFAYTAEYDVKGMEDFFDVETGGNILYDLQYEMEADNPDVRLPELGEDYNCFMYPMDKNPDGTIHIVYFDMVYNKGIDSPKGSYKFCDIPEIEAATMRHKGRFHTFDSGFEKLYKWIEENGYEICGKGRISAINGPWDTEDPDDYVNELQVPVRKK